MLFIKNNYYFDCVCGSKIYVSFNVCVCVCGFALSHYLPCSPDRPMLVWSTSLFLSSRPMNSQHLSAMETHKEEASGRRIDRAKKYICIYCHFDWHWQVLRPATPPSARSNPLWPRRCLPSNTFCSLEKLLYFFSVLISLISSS